MKNSKKLLFMAVVLLLTMFVSCSKKDTPHAQTPKKVVFKAQASGGASIKTIVYGPDADARTLVNQNLASWSSEEMTIAAGTNNVKINVQGTGSGASSTITVQIYVDGVLKAEQSGTGAPAIVAMVTHTL